MKRKHFDVSEDDIRRSVEKKYKARTELVQHAITYLLINPFLWAIWLFTGTSFPWPIFVTASWGIGMLSHYVDYYNKHGKGAQKREEAIEAEVMRQLELARAQDALRRRHLFEDDDTEGGDVYALDDYEQRGMRLSDDGELLDFAPDEEGQLRQR